jgi:DNA-directed RNA polymerase subunit RPC12/RpoP
LTKGLSVNVSAEEIVDQWRKPRMPVVLLRFPEFVDGAEQRPRQCPHCGSQILQRWGRVARKVRDTEGEGVEIYRYKCGSCKRTFRGYPAGLDHNKQTSRLRYLAALAWTLGLSSREVAEFIQNLGIDLSHVTIWRHGQELIASICDQEDDYPARRFTMDKDFVRHISPKLGVVILVELGKGRYEVLGTVDEFNPREVRSWLEPLLKDTNIQVSCLDTSILNQV